MKIIDYIKLHIKIDLFQNFSFEERSSACPASLGLVEKPGRTLDRFDRFFQEPTAQACSKTMRFSA
jgi:hypothetical protein